MLIHPGKKNLVSTMVSRLVSVGDAVVAPVISYLLKATFDAANQSFTDGQVLGSTEGVETGALTVHEKSVAVPGAVEILSNQVKITNGDEWYKDGLQYQTGLTRAIGTTWLCTADGNPAGSSKVFFINNNTGLASSAHDGMCEFRFGRVHYYTPALGGLQVMTDQFTSGTQIRMAIVLGGYDVNGIPYKNGDTKANFTYGYSLFVKGDMFTAWTLMYRSKEYSSATIYPYLTHKTDLATITKIEDFNIPDVDLSTLLEPVVLDTFTDTDTTLLVNHTPDVDTVGGGWLNDGASNELEVSGNKAIIDGVTATNVIDSGESDFIAEVVLNHGTASTRRVSIVGRYQDTDNYWFVDANNSSDTVHIYERTAGSNVNRASVAATQADSTDYRLVAVFDDEEITAFFNDSIRVTYTLATAFKTETTVGLFIRAATQTLDNFAVYPRGTGTEYSDLDNY